MSKKPKKGAVGLSVIDSIRREQDIIEEVKRKRKVIKKAIRNQVRRDG